MRRRLQRTAATSPYVPVAFGIVARRPRFFEPRVLIGSVVDNKVDEYANAALLCFCCQLVPVLQCSIFGRDIRVVGNVVSKIGVGRWEERCNPDRIHAEIFQIVQSCRDPIEVSNAVAVRVLKAARIDFVNDGTVVPVRSRALGSGLRERNTARTEHRQKEERHFHRNMLLRARGFGGWIARARTGERKYMYPGEPSITKEAAQASDSPPR